ncbi:MAG: PAS domain S-box protein [Myxococcales bacterium]|nr:PAS domain S-box protein [Myxococcales bacterium]
MVHDDGVAPMLFEQAPDAVVFADREGMIRAWNEAAERVFGHTPSEAIGRSLDLIIPEQFREAHWRGYNHALAAGDTKYRGQAMPTRSVRRDGTTIYVELTFAIIHAPGGEVIGALAHARDITERWAQEREQRRELRALREQVSGSDA